MHSLTFATLAEDGKLATQHATSIAGSPAHPAGMCVRMCTEMIVITIGDRRRPLLPESNLLK